MFLIDVVLLMMKLYNCDCNEEVVTTIPVIWKIQCVVFSPLKNEKSRMECNQLFPRFFAVHNRARVYTYAFWPNDVHKRLTTSSYGMSRFERGMPLMEWNILETRPFPEHVIIAMWRQYMFYLLW